MDGETYRSSHDQVPLCKVRVVGYDVNVCYRVLLKVGQLLLLKVDQITRADEGWDVTYLLNSSYGCR